MFNDLLKKMGVLEEVPDTAPTTTETPQPQPTVVTPTPVYFGVMPPDVELVAMLNQKIEKSNLPGFDYMEFRTSLDKMKTVLPDERSRYLAVFSTAESMGATKDGIVASVAEYIKVLQKEEKAFTEAFEVKTNADVAEKEKSLVKIDEDIAKNIQAIQDLQKQVSDLQEKKSNISAEIVGNQTKLTDLKNKFYLAYNYVADMLKSDLDKINSFIVK